MSAFLGLRVWSPQASLRERGIDDRTNRLNRVCWELSQTRVFSNSRFIGSDIHTINLVIRDIRLDPLDLRADTLNYVAGCLGNSCQLLAVQRAGAGYGALNDEFGHNVLGHPM